jgi:hypothetical protein
MKNFKTPDKQLIPAVVLVDPQGRPITHGSVFDSTSTYTFDLPSLPKAFTYDGANNVATITYGPDSNGRKVILTKTWNGALLQAESAYVLTGTPAAGLALAGANTAVVGNQSNDVTVTVTPPNSYFSPFTFTPTDGGAGGTFTPSSVNLSYGTRSASFKYTPTAEGVKSLSGVVDQGGLAVAAPLNLTASPPGKAQAPASVTATKGGDSVTLTWPAVPAEGNGGSPVRTYVVKLSNGDGKLVDAGVTSWTFRNLKPGVPVVGTVAAVTDVGAGAVATSGSVTPGDTSNFVSQAVNSSAVNAVAI